ncbi:MAG: septum formation inhibitor Maf [Gammaproteobacteria bacterium]|nr:MAG: septum formation inhibitor Maf [Gammaproteobacteria bacterium]RLA54963.1 MAG: septum formation inhibitor Maf [Gammaproteobacteria bacterium]
MQLVLASSSPYRRELLARLSVPFTWQSPNVDETPYSDETPPETATRLSIAKAEALATAFPRHLIIGSDQVALHRDALISKPGDHENALAQLLQFSGQTVHFLSALCVYHSLNKTSRVATTLTEVHFRELKRDEIEKYLRYEQPYDCAGSFKAEGLGITLFKSINSNDPTAIIGLPLIQLRQLLAEYHYNIIDNIV